MAKARAWPCLAAALLLAAHAGAETLRPLVTEDAETLPGGQFEVQLALEALSDYRSPTQALHGELLRVPIVGLNLGIGPRAELQLRSPLHTSFSPTGEDVRGGMGDVTVATKLRLIGPTEIQGSGLAARIQVKLPNLPNSSGLGSDETDVTFELLGQVEVLGLSVLASAGYAILGDPSALAAQNDKTVVGLGLVLPIGPVSLVADLHGTAWGDQELADRWTALGGLAITAGSFRIDGALGTACSSGEESFLATAGIGATFGLDGD